MTHRTALLASLLLAAGAPCGAQSPAQAPAAPGPAAPGPAAASGTAAQSAASSATPPSSTASSPATAPAKAAGADSAATGSKPAGAVTDASSEPSPEVLKEARREGFKPKKVDGVTRFCQKTAQLGTRFESETCVDEAQLKMLAEQREDQRNQMRQPGACAGSACSGH